MQRALLLCLILTACAPRLTEDATAANPLQGVWRVVERSFVRGDSTWTEQDPQPGFYHFGERYYAVQEIRESGARALFTSETSEEERLAAFDVFHAHSGTYTLADGVLTIQPLLAKSPNSMSGPAASYRVEIDGDRLVVLREAEGEVRTTVLERVE